MKRLFLILLTAVLTFQAAAAAPARSRIVTDSLSSAVLGAQVKYNVYLPAGYDSKKHYPAVYLLHGLYGNYSDWDTKGGIKAVADELIASGEACEMVIIMPNAGGHDIHHVWNGYFNMPGWNYEDFFFSEFIPTAEKKYNCGGSKGRRAVMGLSMGGGGSTVYCQRHPDAFSSCYAMSAWLDEKGHVGRNHKEEDCFFHTCKAVREHSALDFMDNADKATIKQLKTVSWFIDCGDDDSLLDLSVQLHRKMKAAGIKSELRVRNGVHNWEYWHTALRLSLPFASRNFRD